MNILFVLFSALTIVSTTPKSVIDAIPLGGMSLVMEQNYTSTLSEKDTQEAQVKTSSIDIPDEELEVLYRIVEAEATGGTIESKRNVAHVILNRVNSSGFPDTIEDVVFQKKQFSPISDGRYYKVKITDETKSAVQEAIEGEDTTDGALYFCQYNLVKNKNTKRWFDSMTCTLIDDIGHRFYR